MFDTRKLRGRIIEVFGSQNAFAAAAGNSISFVSQYLNGHKVLDQRIIDKWAEVLNIPPEEINVYFFTHKVYEMEQQEQKRSAV